jgi:hypothetical protein
LYIFSERIQMKLPFKENLRSRQHYVIEKCLLLIVVGSTV